METTRQGRHRVGVRGGAGMALAVMLGALIWVLSLATLHAAVPYAGHFSGLAGWPQVEADGQAAAVLRLKRATSSVNLPRVKTAEAETSQTFGRDTVARLARLESSLAGAGVQMRRGSAAHGQLIDSMPEQRALDQGREALAAVKASVYLSQHHCQRYGVQEHKCGKWLSNLKLGTTPLGSACASREKSITCFPGEPYRSLDGSCNHASHPSWGLAYTAYRRLIFPQYSDGIHLPRGPKKGGSLPSARLVSSALARDQDIPDRKLTLAMMQWTQFVEHDLAHTPSNKMVNTGTPLSCCKEDGNPLAPRHIHPLCLPVTIPNDDPFYSPMRVRCMPYIRSVHAFRPDCTYGPAEQMNQATHFLDGSMLYGTSLSGERTLRLFSDGKLLLAKKHGRSFLPPSENPQDRCQVMSDSRACYKSGDVRANMHPHLTTMHTVWAREHNRIADSLSILNPHWDDEKVYQEARRIVMAQMQHITYNHWLPTLLGSRYAQKFGLTSNSEGFADDYRDNMDPSVSNAFATAGLRFVYSMMQGRIKLVDEDRLSNNSLLLRDHFNKPHILEDVLALDSLVRGLATQTSQQIDMFLVEDLTNLLYLDSNDMGMDVVSLDIQRGRDHGLPGYNYYRKVCGLPLAHNFQDFLDVIPQHMVQRISSIYVHPDDVDLLVGGMAETALEGGLVGPTLRCVISEQMQRTRIADRYFYDLRSHPYPFTADQLGEIKKSSLARIFCNNADNVVSMQPDVFSIPSSSNRLTPCTNDQDIPDLDLTFWRENNI